MLFPAPPMPAFPSGQAATTPGYLRYEDVTQDGRLIPLACPPALGGLWRSSLTVHIGHKNAIKSGVLPLLTRMTIETVVRTLKKLRDEGKTVLLITHKLKEVMAFTDRVTVFRAGKRWR